LGFVPQLFSGQESNMCFINMLDVGKNERNRNMKGIFIFIVEGCLSPFLYKSEQIFTNNVSIGLISSCFRRPSKLVGDAFVSIHGRAQRPAKIKVLLRAA